MVFSSITFLVAFLPVVLTGYYCLSTIKTRNLLLLIASIFFYSWGEPKYIFLMILSIIINYIVGLLMEKHERRIYRTSYLFLGVSINLLFLFYFKYFNFSLAILNRILSFSGMDGFGMRSIILPIGISFYTFHSLSYIFDVYAQRVTPERNILNLGLYISFFPQLIAGPIIRYHDIKDQISNRVHNIDGFSEGIERFIVGLSKKVLIANTVGGVADRIFNLPYASVSTYYSWIGILAYTLQIYYDFSGYSDMAIGLGKMFGLHFLENFNYPYISRSISEFWRRWHISLSRWFKDYLYIPLGGNRKGLIRTMVNLFIVFLCAGAWHGASFNFIIWGLGHGFFLSAEKLFKDRIRIKENILTKFSSHIYTLSTVIMLWVVFRVGTKDGIKFILKMFGFNYSLFTGNFIKLQPDPFIAAFCR